MRIDVHHHLAEHHDRKLDRILALLQRGQRETQMDLTKLQAAVEADTAVDTSAKTLIEQIAAELKNSAGDQAAVDALADQLLANSTGLSAAVLANTTAGP